MYSTNQFFSDLEKVWGLLTEETKSVLAKLIAGTMEWVNKIVLSSGKGMLIWQNYTS